MSSPTLTPFVAVAIKQITDRCASAGHNGRQAFRATLTQSLRLLALAALLGASQAFAGSAQWMSTPITGDWNTALNWTPPAVPNGPNDTATFALSNTTTVSISANTEVNSIIFNGASAFNINASPGLTLTISGTGITNSSGVTQNLASGGAPASGGNGGTILFRNSSTAATGNFTANGGAVSGAGSGRVQFRESSLAANGTFVTNGGAVQDATGALTEFFDNSSASNGTFTTNGGAGFHIRSGGHMAFHNNSTAGHASLTNNGATASGLFAAYVEFFDSSTAANGTFINSGGTANGVNGALLTFNNNATAENGTFTNNGGATAGAGVGTMSFNDSSTAASATFFNNGSTVSGASGGVVLFGSTSTASTATITANGGTVSGAGGGSTAFQPNSTAGAATLIANGGTNGGDGASIVFIYDCVGGTARVEVFDNGNLEISRHTGALTIGSIEGNGIVFLGANKLTVGSNDLSTNFSGVIKDGGPGGGTGGSLTKSGSGTLVLSGSNIYTGATTVSGGVLSLTGSLANGAVGINSNAQLIDNGVVGGNVSVSGLLTGCGTINGTLTVNLGGIVDLTGCTLTVNGAITNNGLFILSNGARLAGSSPSFTNNGTLDIITAGTFTPPTGFVNNGVIIDSSVVKTKAIQKTGNSITITIDSYTGHTYQLQKSTTLAANSFSNIGASQQGNTNNVLTFTDPSATGVRGFYRIVVNP